MHKAGKSKTGVGKGRVSAPSITVSPYDDDDRLWCVVGGAPMEVFPLSPPRFDVSDPAALKYFEENGFAVFKDVASPQQIKEAEDLFWESAAKWYHVHKGNVDGWGNDKWTCFDVTTTGVISNDSSAHSPFMWYARGIPKVKQLFASLWNTEDLLVSFDGFGAFRPPELYGQTKSGWFHLDQNGYNKKGQQCAQGLLNIYPSGPVDGGLVVVPGSHLQFGRWFSEGMVPARKSDFVPLASYPLKEWWGPDVKPAKLCLEPGDFVIWDSRTAHCSHPAKLLPDAFPQRLRRLVAYVCMTPRQKAANLKDLQNKREQAYQLGITLNHWPHEYNPHPTDKGKHGSFVYEPVPLSDYQKQLI